jgi:hypothetical protein
VFAAFDDKNIYTFDNMDEFCKWIISIAWNYFSKLRNGVEIEVLLWNL